MEQNPHPPAHRLPIPKNFSPIKAFCIRWMAEYCQICIHRESPSPSPVARPQICPYLDEIYRRSFLGQHPPFMPNQVKCLVNCLPCPDFVSTSPRKDLP